MQIRNMLSQRRTKIVCTIGPATNSERILERLVRAGMDCARLNFSHGSPSEHLVVINAIRKIVERTGRQVAILQDLPGPKFRVGQIKNGSAVIKKNSIVTLTSTGGKFGDDLIPLRAQGLPSYVSPGAWIFLSDGTIKLRVISVTGTEIKCRCEIGGVLLSGKGVNVPKLKHGFETFTQKDRKFLSFGIRHGIDLVAVSFVRNARDVKSVKDFVKRNESEALVFAKIEKKEALENMHEIIQASDGLMVARGDLGVENPIERVPELQKDIISACNSRGIPVITATQMLESMVNNPSPTRAEVTDVANAILDGTDALMLSEETAIGKYPLECVRTLTNVALRAEERIRTRGNFLPLDLISVKDTIDAASAAATQISKATGAKAIIAQLSQSCLAAKVARFRPNSPIFVVSSSEKRLRASKIIWGVFPLKSEHPKDEEFPLQSRAWNVVQAGNLKKGERIVLLHDSAISREHSGVTIDCISLNRT